MAGIIPAIFIASDVTIRSSVGYLPPLLRVQDSYILHIYSDRALWRGWPRLSLKPALQRFF